MKGDEKQKRNARRFHAHLETTLASGKRLHLRRQCGSTRECETRAFIDDLLFDCFAERELRSQSLKNPDLNVIYRYDLHGADFQLEILISLYIDRKKIYDFLVRRTRGLKLQSSFGLTELAFFISKAEKVLYLLPLRRRLGTS